MASIASSVYSGRRVIQLPSFTAEAWLETARANQISHAFVVPTMLARIVDALEGETSAALSSLRALSYGGGKMPQSVIEKAMQLFPKTDFTNAYGLTETSSTISLLGPDDQPAVRPGERLAVDILLQQALAHHQAQILPCATPESVGRLVDNMAQIIEAAGIGGFTSLQPGLPRHPALPGLGGEAQNLLLHAATLQSAGQNIGAACRHGNGTPAH